MMMIRVQSPDLEQPWEGSGQELLEDFELPEHTRRRIETLRVGERLDLAFESRFVVERLA